MNAAQQAINCQMDPAEARQHEVSAQHSAIEAELSEVRESANRAERELSESTTEIGFVSSASAAPREMLFRGVDDADERLTRSEIGSLELSAEVQVLRKRSDDAQADGSEQR
jgi:hypothetical protein